MVEEVVERLQIETQPGFYPSLPFWGVEGAIRNMFKDRETYFGDVPQARCTARNRAMNQATFMDLGNILPLVKYNVW